MEPPDSLPARLYLLAYDLDRGRLSGRYLKDAVAAAALEDLRRRGHLSDDTGKVRIRQPGPLSDPVLDAVLRDIDRGKPRQWTQLVGAASQRTLRAVHHQLEDRLYVRVEHRRVLGIFPRTTVTPRDPRVIEQLQRAAVQLLTDGSAVSHVDSRDAALVAFAALAQCDAVFPGRLRRQHKARIAEFVDRVTPVAPALKKVIAAQAAAAAAAAGG